jgi:hypothetical protein
MGLVRKELIRPDRRRDGSGETYRFRHLLIRDAAYDSLPKLERAELHEQFADWLERTAGDRLADMDEITGYHLDQARAYRLELGPDDERTRVLALRAGHRLAAAGRRTADREEIPTAVRLLSQAETLLADDPAARFDTLLELVYVGFDEDYLATMRVAERAQAVAHGLDDLARRRARLWISGVRGFGDPAFILSDTRAETEEAARAFEAAGDITGLLDAHVVATVIEVNAAHWRDCARVARLGFELAAVTGSEKHREDFAMWLSSAEIWGSTHASESIATVERLLDSMSRRKTRAKMSAGIGLLRAFLGDRPGAEAAQLAATTITDELGQGRSEFLHTYMRYALDDFPDAVRLARIESADLERRGETGQRSTMVGIEAWMLALTGEDDDRAVGAAAESRRLGASDDAVTQIFWRAAECIVLARRGEAEDADRISAEGINVAAGTDSFEAGTAWLARAMVLSILGRRAEATEAARRAREHYAAKGFVNGVRRAEALIAP